MMMSGDIPPNQTIYIKNLNEKVKKEDNREDVGQGLTYFKLVIESLPVDGRMPLKLKRSLYCLFSQFGRILDVVALKTPKLRGQAWLCFSEITAASNAVRQMQNFPFYDKPIRIQYAKAKSDCLTKAEVTFTSKENNKKQQDQAEKKRQTEGTQQNANGTANQNNGGTYASQRRPGGREAASPNNILFVQNLPYNTTSLMVKMLFEQYPGFREVRMIEAKPGIAFVEFEDEDQSTVAMQALQGFKIDPQNPMEITFAKK